MRTLLCTLGVATAGIFAGCGGDGDGIKTFDDLERPLVVEAGKPFAVALSENPSTGYEWQFVERPNAAVVRLDGSDFELEEGGEERTGAGGTRAFRFRAVRPGRTEMVLRYLFTGGGTDGRVQTRRRVVIEVR